MTREQRICAAAAEWARCERAERDLLRHRGSVAGGALQAALDRAEDATEALLALFPPAEPVLVHSED